MVRGIVKKGGLMKNKLENSNSCRRVFLHADDFGMNVSVTDGIIQGFRRGLLTSTSLLSNAPDAARALKLWKQLIDDQAAAQLPLHGSRSRLEDPFTRFDLGVHLNLTQGRPFTEDDYPDELLDEQGRFPGIFALFTRLKRHGVRLCRQIQNELARQVEFLLDRNLNPTHLNGHQYIEMLPVVAESIPQLLTRYDIHVVRVAEEQSLFRSTLLRKYSPHVWFLAHVKRMFAKRFHRRMEQIDVRYPGCFHGTAHAGKIDMSLIRLFLEEAESSRPVEISLHPANEITSNTTTVDADGWTDPLASSRPNELRLITSPELAEYLERHNFRLGRLAQLAAA
jgi:chitin disaccharide deacetylase